MLELKITKKFKRDLKKFQNQKMAMNALKVIIELLLNQIPLESKYCDHQLTGNWRGHRECHVRPDLLLIYKCDKEILHLERVGSHSDLFK